MYSASLTSKGQLTMPRAVRQRLGVRRGDRIVFQFAPDGRCTVANANYRARDLMGVLPPPRIKLTLAQLDEAIAESAAGRRRRRR